jgi:hypothetical protein
VWRVESFFLRYRLKEKLMNNNHLSALKSKHAKIEMLLEQEENRPLPDSDAVYRLKKQKLQLKDAISQELAPA